MDAYSPTTVFSSIDQNGRYQYQNQPGIAQWNLARLAETLLPIIDESIDAAVEKANQIVVDYAGAFQNAWLAGMRRKVGFQNAEEEDGVLIQSLLDLMQRDQVDWTSAFRRLGDSARGDDTPFWSLFEDRAGADQWLTSWRVRLARETDDPMRAQRLDSENPLYIPRNHLVEEALGAAINDDDLGPFEALHEVLANPYTDQGPDKARYAEPAPNGGPIYRTFCGT